MEFREFPKMARFSRDFIITEKIDGTNASVFINNYELEEFKDDKTIIAIKDGYTMRAGSRTKWITPSDDNAGFAKYVLANSDELFKLGEGHHFGEWWGQGIQRNYGLKEKKFSLFNVSRWNPENLPSCCNVVPILATGSFNDINQSVNNCIDILREQGSFAAKGFMKPEGIVIYHIAGNVGFKKTLEKDDTPKSLQK